MLRLSGLERSEVEVEELSDGIVNVGVLVVYYRLQSETKIGRNLMIGR